MAITSKTTKTKTGTSIIIYNNDKPIIESYYDLKLKLQQSIYRNIDGTIKEYDDFKYNTTGQLITETRCDKNGKLLETINFTYTTKNQLDKLLHYDPVGKLLATDYYVNGIFDHTDKFTQQVAQPNGWSNITGHGAIDVLQALADATGTTIQDVKSPATLAWALSSAHFDDAWAAGYTGKGIIIADIDTGIDLNNLDLTSHINKDSWNFINNSSNVQDDNGHGTFTASEMIASNNNDVITGGAYDAEIMVLKALNSFGNGTADNISKAIYYAVDHGADIINMSLNSLVAQPMIKTALDYAKTHDVLVSVSSGNYLSNTPNYPAVYATSNNNVCAVGATFNMNGKEVFNAISGKAGSNTAYNYVDACGTSLTGYDQYGNITTMSGTSMAAPLVASEMAIIKQAIESMGKYANSVIDDMVMNYITHNTHDVQIVGVQPIAGVDLLYV